MLQVQSILIPPRPTAGAAASPDPPKSSRAIGLAVKSLSKSGKLDEALRLIESSPTADSAACSAFLHSCISRRSLQHGRRLLSHLLLREDEIAYDPTLRAKLVTLCSVCGRVDEARRIFEDVVGNGCQDESVWVAMAVGLSRNGRSKEALIMYSDMVSLFGVPGQFALSVALKACTGLSDLRFGRAVHGQIVKSREEPDQVVNNALFSLYSKCGCFNDALRVFDDLPNRNVVSWNSLIAAFSRQNQVAESFDAFRRMQREGVEYSWVTLTTILALCATATALLSGKEVHAKMVKCGESRPDVLVLNSLMDMYAKCGEVDYCRDVFNLMQEKDLTTWNIMLNCYAINGCMDGAFVLFDDMVTPSGFKPDEITFISLLSGCSDAGLVDEGIGLFNEMKAAYGISPTSEHYACLVDLLGRAGKIKEALHVAKNMPMTPTGSVWGSLLNSCRLHGRVSEVQEIASRLFELEPDNPGNYVILSNIYADAGMWEDAWSVRGMMDQRGIKKQAGCSWTQLRNKVHVFVAGGSIELQTSPEYRTVWSHLTEAMQEAGYSPDTRAVLHDVNEETRADWVCGHSERIATMFTLINTAQGMPIRITKNLRVCSDCHSWMKFLSQVTKRLIVLRDTNRFHHFREGACSCKDYW